MEPMKRSSRRNRNDARVGENDSEVDETNGGKIKTPARELRKSVQGKRKPSSSKSPQVEFLNLEDDDSETDVTKSISFDTPTDDGTMTGSDIFTFKNAKPKNSMKEKAASSVEEHSKFGSASKSPTKTPTRESRNEERQISAAKKESNTATKKGKSNSQSLKEPYKIGNPVTPHSTRRQTSKRLQKILLNEESSSDDGDIIDSESVTTRQKNKSSSQAAENYFRAHGDKSDHTSKKTLPKLDIQDIDTEKLSKIVSSAGPHHKEHLTDLKSHHRSKFRKWMFQLQEGFNLLFYGFGSKYSLLQEFQTKMLPGYDTVIINGFFPSLTVKEILCTVTELLEVESKLQNPAEQLNCIREELLENERELFLIVHNIDGSLLRNDKAQSVLCKLAQMKGVHMLASIDHINAPLIWDQAQCGKFNWLWHDITTYEPYIQETCNNQSMLLLQQSSSLALSSLIHVFRSLTPNAKGIFLLLANYQLSQKDAQNYHGMPFQDFYSQCREAFLVNSDATMRAQLTEFKDHKLVRSKKDPEGTECMLIPLEQSILEEFVEQHSENC